MTDHTAPDNYRSTSHRHPRFVYRDVCGAPTYHHDATCWDHTALRDALAKKDIDPSDYGDPALITTVTDYLARHNCVIDTSIDSDWLQLLQPCPHCTSTHRQLY